MKSSNVTNESVQHFLTAFNSSVFKEICSVLSNVFLSRGVQMVPHAVLSSSKILSQRANIIKHI